MPKIDLIIFQCALVQIQHELRIQASQVFPLSVDVLNYHVVVTSDIQSSVFRRAVFLYFL